MAKRKPKAAPVLDPEIAEWLPTYVCGSVQAATWPALAGFVCQVVTDFNPQGLAGAKKLALSVARLAEYSHSVGVPLTVKAALHPDNIDSCLTAARRGGRPGPWVAGLSESSVTQLSSHLKRVGRALNPAAPWPQRVPKGRASTVTPPYSSAIEAAFFRKARRSRSPHQLGLVVLGFGAGLAGRELPLVFTDDIIEHDGAFWVRAPKPERLVPLPQRYANDMRKVLAALAPGSRIIGGAASMTNRVSSITEDISKGLTALNASGMRSTWLVRHVNNGCDIRYLARMAGTTTAKTIWQIMAFAAPVDDAAMANRAFRA